MTVNVTKRPLSEGAEKWLGVTQNVKPNGMVRLVDYMGNDSAIVQAARVSYGAGTKSVSEDTALIRYLVRNHHSSPLEMCELKFHISGQIDMFRQLVRHRTLSLNEVSTRYSIVTDEAPETPPEQWRMQSTDNKQGSGGYADAEIGQELSIVERMALAQAKRSYEGLIAAGVAREQARRVLPLATTSEMYIKVDLRNLFHLLWLRTDSHAQLEIREIANAIAAVTQDAFPNAYNAYLDYMKNSTALSSGAFTLIQSLMNSPKSFGIDTKEQWKTYCQSFGLSKREATELAQTLAFTFEE